MGFFEVKFDFSVNLPCSDCIFRLKKLQYDRQVFLRHETLSFDFYPQSQTDWELTGELLRETHNSKSVINIKGFLQCIGQHETRFVGQVSLPNSWMLDILLFLGCIVAIGVFLHFVSDPVVLLSFFIVFCVIVSTIIFTMPVGFRYLHNRLKGIVTLIKETLGIFD